jgi:hypothetical protein
MEINITRFFNEAAPMDYSASVAEIGRNAGPDTWRAAKDDAPDWNFLDTDEKCQTFRDYCKGFGAWDDEERAAWSATECNALLIQMIAGDIREVPDMDPLAWDWTFYNALVERGTISGRLYRGDDGQIYYYVGS